MDNYTVSLLDFLRLCKNSVKMNINCPVLLTREENEVFLLGFCLQVHNEIISLFSVVVLEYVHLIYKTFMWDPSDPFIAL